MCEYMCVSHHRLQRGPPGPQGPSQVSQHCQVPLLDQVVPAAHLQLAPQVGGGVEVLTVLPGAATLGGEREGGGERERGLGGENTRGG